MRTGEGGHDYLGNWADAKLIRRNDSDVRGSGKEGIQIKGESGLYYDIIIPAGKDSRIARLYFGGNDARVKIEANIGIRHTYEYLEQNRGKANGLYEIRYSSDKA